jgi:hypothetical protein
MERKELSSSTITGRILSLSLTGTGERKTVAEGNKQAFKASPTTVQVVSDEL